jgi:hypothetical protein
MKPFSEWNAPVGLLGVLCFGFLMTGSLFLWIGYIGPHLSSFIAEQTQFADKHPFLYYLADTAAAVMALPWSMCAPFSYLYMYQCRYDRKMLTKQ